MILGELKIHSETTTVRECSRCGARWPDDWDYCQNCNVWLPGHERAERITTIVPAEGATTVPQLEAGGTLVVVQIRHGQSFHAPAQHEESRELLEGAMAAIAVHGGRVAQIRNRGIAGYWTDPSGATERAARAICSFMAKAPPSEVWGRSTRMHRESVTLGVAGILANQGDSSGGTVDRAFRLAALAHPDRAFFSRGAYEKAVERFDFRGMQPVVPKAENLEPVFELIGPKPERSGTHHVGPETVAMVGRGELLKELERCRLEVAKGKSLVIHLVAEPGLGKSKLIREWLGGCERFDGFGGWIRLLCNGVPYGDYPRRSWQRLVAPVVQSGKSLISGEIPTAREVCHKLQVAGVPVLILADDVHWIDVESQELIVELFSGLSRTLTVLAYRPSFAGRTMVGIRGMHRRFQLAPLSENEVVELVELLAGKAGVELSASAKHGIATKSRGSPLYAKEAVAHVAVAGDGAIGSLPCSLLELLVFRTEWTARNLLPNIERRRREQLFCGGGGRDLVDELEKLEEQLSAWLDRFDVIEEQSAQVVAQFLDALSRVDSKLAMLSILFGRQRPHRNRLAQALTRVERFVESAKNVSA